MILAALVCVLRPALVIQQGPGWDTTSPMSPAVKRALAEQPHWKYTGTREVTVRRGAEVSQHTEYITRDGWNLRIDFPADSRYGGQVIVETDKERLHFNPKKDEIHVSPPRREPLFEHIRGAWRGVHTFHVVEAAGQRVAGLPTRLVSVVDGSGNRIQELNIEPRSGVVLARRIYDDVGTQIRSFEFRTINLHPHISPTVFEFHTHAKVVTPVDDLIAAVKGTQFLPLMIPPDTGLTLDSARVRKIAGQQVLMSQYLTRDGWVALFQLSVGVDPNSLDRQAPKHIHTATTEVDGRWFVAVGIVDESVLKDAIKRLETAHPHRRGRGGHGGGHGHFGRF